MGGRSVAGRGIIIFMKDELYYARILHTQVHCINLPIYRK